MKAQEMEQKYAIASIQKSILILKSFSPDRLSQSMTDLHKYTGISIPSLQRILSTLLHGGLLQKDEKTKQYRLGMELYFLGSLVEKDSSLLNTALPYMEEIRDKTGESVSLNINWNSKRKCIGYCESKHELTTLTYIGHESPLYAGASAKVLLAYMEREEIQSYFEKSAFLSYTNKTIVDRDKLLKELQLIKEKGFAISYGERVKGAFSVSVPIFNPLNQIIAGMSIAIPIVRLEEFNQDDLIILLKQKAKEISQSFV
ncbi:IclR family transcriptional regulator [Planococcus salinus]|uniref:IclR family transcriptional regulator n=1 Tax=Planococcus salinus TaxID=1848460 RepID=A0A3M8P7T2_9BACL|nr:IclR family transcriptional regulator [Planococcus salinus]RNF39749.1 IclR family transcriptional regulator [Planococcus salinus]